MTQIDDQTELQARERIKKLQAIVLEMQERCRGFYKREAAALEATKRTRDRALQLRALIANLPVEDRQGRLMRVVELADIVTQGLDNIESAFSSDIQAGQ